MRESLNCLEDFDLEGKLDMKGFDDPRRLGELTLKGSLKLQCTSATEENGISILISYKCRIKRRQV